MLLRIYSGQVLYQPRKVSSRTQIIRPSIRIPHNKMVQPFFEKVTGSRNILKCKQVHNFEISKMHSIRNKVQN